MSGSNARRSTTGLLVVALFALWPFAHASPIDHTRIAGFWDDGDYDEVVILVTSTAAAADVVADCFSRSTGPRVGSPTQPPQQ